MPDEAVMDAALDTDVQDTGLDTGAEAASEDTASQSPAENTVGDQATTAPKPLVDGGKLSQEAKETLAKIKAENPKLARDFERSLYKVAQFEKALPGGLKEVEQLRQTVETLGGPNGIQEIQAEVNGWHQFDEQYMAGDPKAVEFMTSEPEGQEAFLKLIPSAIQKYEQLHPEGYRNYMAQVFNATANQSDIPLTLMRLADLVGDNPRAMEQLQRLDGFFKFIKGEASKQVEAPKFQKEQQDDGRSQFEQEKSAFEREKWKAETAAEQQKIALDEWNRMLAGRKLTDAQKAHIAESFELKLNQAIEQKHKETLERYFTAKDRAGFLRYASQISKTEVPRIMRAVFDAVAPGKPAQRPTNGAPPPPVKNGAPARGVPIAQGFTQVAQRPDYKTQVDLRNPFNNAENMRKGLAILKDGKKVRWTIQA
jgi:hypothetical protein